MGLDMYLSVSRYVSDHNEAEKGKRTTIKELLFADFPANPNTEIYGITAKYMVAYWRKANHIHRWFVDNVQNGKDECQESYVTVDQLIELLDVCREVKKRPGKAHELLPTQAGFFFGGTEYDEWYRQDIESTVSQLEPLIDVIKNDSGTYDVYYQSSW